MPEVQTREMESVLQVSNGQTVVLGGLMQDDVGATATRCRSWARTHAGRLFRSQRDVTKTELVIFLRTDIVTNPSLESDELKFFQRFLPRPETPPDLPRCRRTFGA